MGWYVSGPAVGKVRFIVEEHGGRVVDADEASRAVDSAAEAVIAVKQNGFFEAAGYCYDRGEFDAFNEPDDRRPTTFILMDRAKAEELVGFPESRRVAKGGVA